MLRCSQKTCTSRNISIQVRIGLDLRFALNPMSVPSLRNLQQDENEAVSLLRSNAEIFDECQSKLLRLIDGAYANAQLESTEEVEMLETEKEEAGRW